MTKPTNRKKRSKLARILFAPIFPLFFIAGWSLYCIGQPGHQNTKQPQTTTAKTSTKQDAVELFMIPQAGQILAD